jgi:hypothetical protein
MPAEGNSVVSSDGCMLCAMRRDGAAMRIMEIKKNDEKELPSEET